MKKILNYFNSRDNFLLSLVLFYSLAFGLILFNQGIFWDDWTLFHVSQSAILEEFSQVGIPMWGYIHTSILSLSYGIFIYRLLIFVFYLVSGLFLNNILKKIKQIEPFSRFFLISFFLLFPLNFARIASIDFPYALCYFLFFAAFALLAKYLEEKRLLLRLISLILFLISFFMNSLLVFYLVTIIYLGYFERADLINIKGVLHKVIKYLDFLILPIVFWTFKAIFFKPYGLYQNYNKIDFKIVSDLPLKIVNAFELSFINVVKIAFNFIIINPFPILILSLIIYLLISKIFTQKEPQSLVKTDIYLLVFGIVAFCLAVSPYILIGAMPTITEWTSRHQILIPLSASFILYYGIKIIIDLLIKKVQLNFEIQKAILSLFIALFIFYNFINYLDFQKDWFKQLSLKENFKSNDVLKNNTSFLFIDHTQNLNAIGRSYRFYEYNGLLKSAFNNEIRFGVGEQGDKDIRHYKDNVSYPSYSMTNFILKRLEYKIIIEPGSISLSNPDAIKLLYYQEFNHPKFDQEIQNVVKLREEKIN